MSAATAAEYWGQRYFDASFNRAEWQGHPLSIERQSQIQGGLMREDWFAVNFLGGKPAKRAIGIGVGRAETELALLAKGYVEHFDLYDVSAVGLDHARQTAIAGGFGDRLSCHCADVGDVELPAGVYDLVTFVASLHHMIDLEKTLKQVRAALKADGIMWAANEYVGPDRFGYPEDHLKVVRAFHSSLQKRFRKHGDSFLHLPTPQEVAANDPSEAPCSSEIIPALKRAFPKLEVTDLYGSFAFMLFWGLNHDALYDTREGAELVEFILNFDRQLVERGVLPGYFAHLVAYNAQP